MKNQFTIVAFAVLFVPFGSHAQSARTAILVAETAFAAQAAQAGTTAAFLANAAPTALIAEKGRLASAQDVGQARPARPGSRFIWYPVLADVAQSGDLGYTTGPWTTLQN